MAHRDIIVIGASMGGVEALPRLAAQLPGDLPAAVLVVMHLSPHWPSYLPEMLNRAGPLRATAARDGERIERGRIYVAVPAHHLMIQEDRIRLSSGPRESHARPSVDVLFRSAAFHCGPRAIGIVLTGMLDDGTAGLWAIKDRGGIAIVQAPLEAAYPAMPRSALQHVKVDYTLKLQEMPQVLRALTAERLHEDRARMPTEKLQIENGIALGEDAFSLGVRKLGSPSFYTCPECHGSMVAIEEGSFKRFRCHTGHGFTPKALSAAALPRIEDSLWGALAQLEEREAVLKELEQAARARSDPEGATEHAEQAARTRQVAERLRELALEAAAKLSGGMIDSPQFKNSNGPSAD